MNKLNLRESRGVWREFAEIETIWDVEERLPVLDDFNIYDLKRLL